VMDGSSLGVCAREKRDDFFSKGLWILLLALVGVDTSSCSGEDCRKRAISDCDNTRRRGGLWASTSFDGVTPISSMEEDKSAFGVVLDP
jgi:hypothetical protein